MARQPKKPIEQVVADVGRYPLDAYQFVREGLSFTVERMHGKETAMERRIHKLMHEHDIDLQKLGELYEASQLPDPVMRYIKKVGGVQTLNRHVCGRDLCWGLRDYALKRWGLMAIVVLRGWNILCTEDFGRMVFALVDNEFMQKEPQDTIDDFRDVYDFKKAFNQAFKIGGGD